MNGDPREKKKKVHFLTCIDKNRNDDNGVYLYMKKIKIDNNK